jgi:1A family penicillin-binding protein
MLWVRDTFVYAWYILAGVGVFAALTLLFMVSWAAQMSIPSVDGFRDRAVSQSTKIYDRTGKVLLFSLHGDVQRTVIPFNDISRHIKNATIAIEDTDFYEHNGIRLTSIARAVVANLTSGELKGQGGSTITQQVVKNTLLTPEKTITRKVKEWILSLALEKKMTKDEILSIYLNEMPYGGNLYGVEETSKRFFGKSASEVTLSEAAYLAALPQAPSYFSPYGEHVDELTKRKNLVLSRMHSQGFISKEELEKAQAEVVTFAPYGEKNIKAPHFVFWLRDQIEEKYGSEAVYNGGLTVISTIDWRLQEAGEDIIKRYATQNEKDFDAENAALVALDPKTGQILAMVGSRDYFDEGIDGKFNVATALRQPGSTMKPIAYATAFERGYTPDTVVFDVPTQFAASCPPEQIADKEGCYAPGNYDDVFRGPMTLRSALAQSINIPAVKVMYLAGQNNVLQKARAMGLKSLTKSAGHYGLPLVLGGGEVTPLELSNAYATIAADGLYRKPVGMLAIKDAQGAELDTFTDSPQRVLSQQAARLVADVLSDNTARAPSYGNRNFLVFDGIDVAGKTGTTNDFRDVWVAGFTPSISVIVWAGNNDNSPIVKKVAGYVIAPMWRKYMDQALKHVPHDRFPQPDPIDYAGVPPVLAGDYDNGSTEVHSILQFVNKEDPRGGAPNPWGDSQFPRWEWAVRNWVSNNALAANGDVKPLDPSASTPAAPGVNPEATGSLTFASPLQGAQVASGTPMTMKAQYTGKETVSKIDYSVNGLFIGSSNAAPYEMTFVPTKREGLTPVKATAHMQSGGTITTEIGVNVTNL